MPDLTPYLPYLASIVTGVLGLIGGRFGLRFLDRWFDRDMRRLDLSAKGRAREISASEQASEWLMEQLEAARAETEKVRSREYELLKNVADLAAQVARQEERIGAMVEQIKGLQALVERSGHDYEAMKLERDQCRAAKEALEARLHEASLRSEVSAREIELKDQEIERLNGLLDERRGGVR